MGLLDKLSLQGGDLRQQVGFLFFLFGVDVQHVLQMLLQLSVFLLKRHHFQACLSMFSLGHIHKLFLYISTPLLKLLVQLAQTVHSFLVLA